MSAVDKRAAGFRGATTQYQINLRKREMAIERSRKPTSRKGTAGKAVGPAKPKAKASTSYSPKPMSAEAKKYAGFRAKYINSLSKDRMGTATKSTARGPKAGTATVAAIAKRFGVTAREARDIATAVSTVIKTSSASGAGKQYAVKNLKTQIKETAKAATTGKKGTRSGETMPTTDRGNMYIDPIYAKLRKQK
jgi:hypothetical protein